MSIRLNGMSESLGNGRLTSFSHWEFGEALEPDDKIITTLGKRAMFLLNADEYLNLPSNAMFRTSFIEQEEFGLGREDSKHLARFGQMILNGGGKREMPDFVALKTYDQPAELQNEWAANAYANGIYDEQRAFLPLGVYKNQEGDVGMVSLYENNVVTADSVFWADREINPGALQPEIIEDMAVTCMRGLGLLHGARIIHNDAQAKNLGSDNRLVRFVDLEDAELIPEDATDSDNYAKKVMRDVAMFISSTAQVEENIDQIAEVMTNDRVVTSMMQGYRDGLAKGRRQQPGLHIPDYAGMHEEQIRTTIDKTFGTDKAA